MADGITIRELTNVLNIEVDEASAAKAEAAMRGWKTAAEEVGRTLADVGGNVAAFLNSLASLSQVAEAGGDVSALAKPLRGLDKAALKLGATLTDLGPWFAAFNAQVLEYQASMGGARAATDEVRQLLAELRGEGQKTGKGLDAVSKGLADVKAAAAQAQAAQKAAAKSTRHVGHESEGATDRLVKFGEVMRGVREVAAIAREGYDLLVGGLVETAKESRAAAQVSGVSTRFFQEQAYAAQSVGFQADDLRDVFVDLADKSYDASTGSKEHAASFAALGVSVRDLRTGQLKPMEDLFLDVADGLAKMGEGTKRTGLASKLLGEQGSRLLPVLSEGREGLARFAAEAEHLGLIISDDTLASSREFEASSRQLGATLTGIRNTIGTALLPVLTKAAKEFQKFLAKNRELIKTKVKDWVKAFSVAADIAVGVMKHLKLIVAGVAAVMVAQYLPAIASGITMLSTLTAAQVTWGSAALIAGARAAVGALLPLAGWLALAALIVLVTEDLYQFGTGGESVFGEFDKWVNSFDPEDNALVLFVKAALKGITTLVRTSTELLFDITNPEKWKAYLKALINYIIPFSAEIMDLLNPFGATGDGGAGGMDIRMGARQRAGPTAEERFAASVAPPAWAGGYAATASGLSGMSAAPTAYFGRGGSAETAASAMMSSRGATGTFAPSITINQEIPVLPGQSAADVARVSATMGSDKMASELRNAQAAFSRGGAR